MLRHIKHIALMLFCACLLVAGSAQAVSPTPTPEYVFDEGIRTSTDGLWKYLLSKPTDKNCPITLLRYNGSFGTTMTIPAAISQHPVTGVAGDCFGTTMNKYLKEVTFSEGFELIGPDLVAGFDSTAVTKVNLPSTLKTIDQKTFYCYTALTDVMIPSGVNKIGDSAFQGCRQLKTAVLPVCALGKNVFSGCSSLSGVTMAGVPVSVGSGAFNGTALTDIGFTAGWTGIPDRCFAACSGLVTVTVPDTVVSIGASAFSECTALTGVTLPNGLTALGKNSFYGCTALTDVTLPDGLEQVSDSLFSGCAALKRIAVPDSVRTIGYMAFYGCTALSEVRLGSGIESIEGYAFYNCGALTHIRLPSSLRQLGFTEGRTSSVSNVFHLSGIRNLSIPEGVRSIHAAIGMAASGDLKWYLPQSLESIEGTIPDFVLKRLTIYCPEYSYADQYAAANGIRVIYTDAAPFSQYGTLTVGNVELEKGEQAIAAYQIFPDDGTAPNYYSSDASVFTVTQEGLITAVGGGTAVLSVRKGDYTGHGTVTVHVALQDYALDDLYTVAKEPVSIRPRKVPADADGVFRYEVDNTLLARVDENGVITTTGVGTATVTVTEELTGLVRTATLYACYPVTAVAFDADSMTLEMMTSAQLVAHVTARTQTYDNRLVTFGTSDPAVVRVTEDGTLTPVAVGRAVITATASNGVSASCNVLVTPPSGLVLPKGIRVVADEAFSACGLTQVYVPEGCITIGAYAFAYNTGLRRVFLPQSVTSIARNAFTMCYEAVIVAPADSYAIRWAKQNGFYWEIR